MMAAVEETSEYLASVGSEWEVLGTLLATPDAHYALDVLRDEHFTDPAAKLLFSLIVRVAVDGGLPSMNAIAPLLRGQEVGGLKDWKILAMATQRIGDTSLDTLQSNIISLKEYSGRRRMTNLAERLHVTGGSVFSPILPGCEHAIKELDEIAAELRNTKSTSHTVGELS